jgi:hypothetical protein
MNKKSVGSHAVIELHGKQRKKRKSQKMRKNKQKTV